MIRCTQESPFLFFTLPLTQPKSATTSQNTEERVMFRTFLVMVVAVVTGPFIVLESTSHSAQLLYSQLPVNQVHLVKTNAV